MYNYLKSFAYRLNPLSQIRLTNDKYDNIDTLLTGEESYWMDFEKPSKNLQQQLTKKLNIPKNVKTILFAEEETRPRFVKCDHSYLLVLQGIDPQTMVLDTEIPWLRLWITPKGILSISNADLRAIHDLQEEFTKQESVDLMQCLMMIIEYMTYYIEETTYNIDEKLYAIEVQNHIKETANLEIISMRQDVIQLRRYVIPERDAMITLANKMENLPPNIMAALKELNENMQRYAETIDSLRDRAIVIQDRLSNQLAEVSNRRMYILTVIMLIFTPAFFIMGLFSMYVPIPGMNSEYTWWILLLSIIVSSVILLYLFRVKKWL